MARTYMLEFRIAFVLPVHWQHSVVSTELLDKGLVTTLAAIVGFEHPFYFSLSFFFLLPCDRNVCTFDMGVVITWPDA